MANDRIVIALVAAFVAIFGSVAHAGDPLEGFWKAQRFYGPEARGSLVIEKIGDRYLADMMGVASPVAEDGGVLSFRLPDRKGTFIGKLERGDIVGHWRAPGTAVTRGAFAFASPVRLIPSGKGRWEGEVEPLDDRMTFYLKLEQRPDGTLGAVFRNPERNEGVFLNADRLARDGDKVRLIGKRLGRAEESVLLSGRYDAENDILTLDYPGRGGSYDFRREGGDSLFYPRGANPGRYSYRPPLARDDGWPTASLGDVGIDLTAIETFIQSIIEMPIVSVDTPEIHGILIARHGKLVLEEYFHGEHRDKMHDTRSAAKSLTAAVVGAAIEAGAPLALSSPVYETLSEGADEIDPLKRKMTLEHLLTMSAGYFCDDTDPDAPGNENAMLDQETEPDYVRFALNVPMATPPGEASVYCSIEPNLALAMAGKAAGESPLTVFDRLLGRPMKIERYGWIQDPAGAPYGGGSVNMLPRDFMKLGQLMLNEGTWNGRRILSRDFVRRALTPQYHLRGVYYGYLWWGADWPYKDRTVRAWWAGGNGGQGVAVIPELDLVIATYGGNYASRQTVHITQELPPRFVLPAVREAGDDPDAPIAFNQYVSPYGRSPINGPATGAEGGPKN